MQVLEKWHSMIAALDPGGLDEILADDCVFYSPVVHSPQEGKALTTLYLTGAMNVFNESFTYIKEVVTDTHAVLEFECTVDGIIINGVDIMTFNEEGKISEFKVMVRPLKGIGMLQAKMKAMLEELSSQDGAA